MKRLILLGCVIALSSSSTIAVQQKDEVFSGPQRGETLPEFNMKLVLGGKTGSDANLVKNAEDGPVVVAFVHQLTRPAFALVNSVMNYCRMAGDEKLSRGICFLSQDPSLAQTQIERAKRYFTKDTLVGYSIDGIEGPGAYGLNRNVQVTILIATQKKVVANFALIQPGVHADGPKILQAIATVIGANKKPDINDYLRNNQAVQDAPIAIDPALMSEIRKLNSDDSDAATVTSAIIKLDQLTQENKSLQQQLASVAARWVRSKKIDKIGTKEQQATIRKWAQQFVQPRGRQMRGQQRDEKLTGLLREMIQKTNSDKQVDEAAQSIEDYINDNKTAKAELKRISTTVVNGGKLQNYGTSYCQEKLKAWAERFKSEN